MKTEVKISVFLVKSVDKEIIFCYTNSIERQSNRQKTKKGG